MKVRQIVQLFAWRACRDAIPVGGKLRKRGVSTTLECICCSHDSEDLSHFLLLVHFRQASLGIVRDPIAYHRSQPQQCGDVDTCLRGELGRRDFDLFLMICWSLWCRNQLVFKAKHASVMEVVERARRGLWVNENSPRFGANGPGRQDHG
ncbi:UNVERIFIED_CONTAM: hypothetical protein Slati_3184000 [Sesamum latifolium]|uniref:Reverse transcriptase zinc-binding domain-containing protein n=1 Tax=Sesamum latifolium TaxID=2727402 RepID=A0AAW2UX11_9LAMI